VALAGNSHINPVLLAVFALGAVVMRGAGCIVNDIIDRDLDKYVERTRARPLASGAVTVTQAGVLLFLLLCTALCIALAMNRFVLVLAALSLVFVASYPFMKRITWWPQAFLGITFNWGALMGWAAVKGDIELPAVLLYAGCVFWTLGYDTIYAHQDKADDVKIGIKSTALKLGKQSKAWIAGFYGLALLNWALAGIATGRSLYYAAGLAAVAAHLLWQVKSVNIDEVASCRKVFSSNSLLGLIMFLSLCI
jgi:4-hydroxybenzoate polyprenyltransferase